LKSQVGDVAIKEKHICYVCEKIIKPTQPFYAIGKNDKGIELYRHRKCKPPRGTK
jgi:hypothetical protein